MRIRYYSIIWIILGLLEFVLGIYAYKEYSSGKLFFVIMPEEFNLKNVIFGLCATIIGIGLYKSPARQIPKLLAFSVAIILFLPIVLFQGLIYDIFDCLSIAPGYLYLILVYFTIRAIQKQQTSKLKHNWFYAVIGGILINIFIFAGAEFLPYSLFYR